MFFACAPQTIDLDGVPVRFEVDPNDTAVCRMIHGDWTLTFQRNGPLLSMEQAEKEGADGVPERDEEPIAERQEPAAGNVAPPAGDAEPLAVSG